MILFKGKQNDLDTAFPPMLKIDGVLCVRNGISSRSRLFIGVYDIALYLSQLSEDANEIIESNSAKQLRMITRRPIKGTALGKAFKDGLRANCTAEEFQQYEATINEVLGDALRSDMLEVGELFTIDFSPNHGVRLSYESNQDLPYTMIEGLDKALLRTWIGDNPISQDMKRDLLGL